MGGGGKRRAEKESTYSHGGRRVRRYREQRSIRYELVGWVLGGMAQVNFTNIGMVLTTESNRSKWSLFRM